MSISLFLYCKKSVFRNQKLLSLGSNINQQNINLIAAAGIRKIKVFGVNTASPLEWDYSDTLSFVFDYHDSSAEKEGTEIPNELGFVAPADATLTHYNGGKSGINTFAYDREFDEDDYTNK